MRIAVVGPGGVGGLVAGLLARAGHDVVLIARGAALTALRDHGVRVDSPLGTFSARVEAVASPEGVTAVDAALLAVKSWQVPDVARQIAPLLGAKGFVVPLQNGVDAPRQCVDALGVDRVVGGLCHMLSWATEPGAVKHVGAPPSFTLGAWQSPSNGRAEALVAALAQSGADARVVADFPVALWDKFLFIASFGGVAALTRLPAGEWRAVAETRSLLVAAFEEVRAVAVASGVALPAAVVDKTVAFVDALPEAATPSLQRDVVAGRPSELESLSGAVVRIGAQVGVDTPVHRAILAALLPLERKARLSR
jgi:2-dehydropantoate 2-reductase